MNTPPDPAKLQKQIVALQTQLTTLNTDIEKAKTEKTDLETQIASRKTEKTSLDTQIASLKKNKLDAETAEQAAKSTKKKADKDAKEAKTKLENLEAEIKRNEQAQQQIREACANSEAAKKGSESALFMWHQTEHEKLINHFEVVAKNLASNLQYTTVAVGAFLVFGGAAFYPEVTVFLSCIVLWAWVFCVYIPFYRYGGRVLKRIEEIEVQMSMVYSFSPGHFAKWGKAASGLFGKFRTGLFSVIFCIILLFGVTIASGWQSGIRIWDWPVLVEANTPFSEKPKEGSKNP